MKNYSLRTYKYLDAKFKSILMDKDASWRTYCISCLNKKTKNYKQQDTDVVFVTCLVNTNTINSRKNLNKDFIFGTMIRDLKKLYNIKVIYIN